MNIFERLFRDTLNPTERELLEAEAAWWKDSAAHWRQAHNEVSDKNLIHWAGLINIRDYTATQKSGTAQKVHRMASEALKS